MKRSTMTLIGTTLVLLTSVSARAQINPYAPPFPGAVLVQPCGSEPGWVPASHPLAGLPPCGLQGEPPPVPGPQAPATLQVGKVYRHRAYHLVIVVHKITTIERFNFETLQVERAALAEVITYQSEDLYRQRLYGNPSGTYDPARTWDWFEIAR